MCTNNKKSEIEHTMYFKLFHMQNKAFFVFVCNCILFAYRGVTVKVELMIFLIYT